MARSIGAPFAPSIDGPDSGCGPGILGDDETELGAAF